MKKTIRFLIALTPWLLFSGCAGLRDNDAQRPAPTDPDATLMADMQADLDAGPLSWSR